MAELVSFTRVSTRLQVQYGESLAAQAARIEEYARQHQHTIIGHFSDEGLSGRSLEGRLGIQQAVAMACRRRGRILCVASLSRVARNVKDCIDIGDQLRRSGSSMVSISEALNSEGATGRLIWTLLAAVHAFMAEVGAENTASVLQSMSRRGLRVSGIIRYGYRLNPDGRTLAPEPGEQEVITTIRRLRDESRLSFAKIATALESAGITTRSGKTTWLPKVVAAVYAREDEQPDARVA